MTVQPHRAPSLTGRLRTILTGQTAEQPMAYVGRHRAPEPAGPEYSPLAPAIRQELAPTHYAERQLPAGPNDRTGLMLPVDGEVAR